jgi:hypothetical protein
MRKFRVICLNVLGHSNKIYRHGDIVPESAFPPGHADEYVKSKHMEEVFEEPEIVEPEIREFKKADTGTDAPVVPEEPKVQERNVANVPVQKKKTHKNK